MPHDQDESEQERYTRIAHTTNKRVSANAFTCMLRYINTPRQTTAVHIQRTSQSNDKVSQSAPSSRKAEEQQFRPPSTVGLLGNKAASGPCAKRGSDTRTYANDLPMYSAAKATRMGLLPTAEQIQLPESLAGLLGVLLSSPRFSGKSSELPEPEKTLQLTTFPRELEHSQ